MKYNRFGLKFKLHIFALVVILCFFSYVILISIADYNRLNAERAAVLQKIEDEKAIENKLKTEIDLFETDAYTEKVAREVLGLVKPDEIIYKRLK